LTVTLPASLKSRATEDTKNLISWGAVTGQNGVRFLLPVVLYRPDSTTPRLLDGTLGCPAATTPAVVCFGLQPDVALRIAVVDLNGKTLVAWARSRTTPAHPSSSPNSRHCSAG
jgi:hypothetical protein